MEINDIVGWLDEHQGTVMSILTFVYVIATVMILRANNISVKEMRKTREEENRPYIVIYFDTKTNGVVNFVIKNIGKTLARNVSVKVNPEIPFPDKAPLSKSHLLNDIIPNIPPNFEYKVFLEIMANMKSKNQRYTVYTANVTYTDSFNKITYKEKYILDLNIESGLLSVREMELHDLAKDFNDFNKNHKKNLDAINQALIKIVEK